MKMIDLKERPKNPIIIEGFPGFGFVSTIVTEFLIKHLNAKRIGSIYSTKLKPMVAIHDSEVIDPLEVYYDKKHNIIILRALANVNGAEWDIATILIDLAKKLKAKEVIGIEGVASDSAEVKTKAYYFTNQKGKKFDSCKVDNFKNGVVVGVTGVLLLKEKEIPLSCIFVEADPTLPDSRAAGEVVKVLDEYLGLKVDYKPLIKAAEQFEDKLKHLMGVADKAEKKKQEKEIGYLG
ncbi:hypothetical protein A3K73_01105 [Candidatus Pacearchaeota archaeon RBG_13_36_9]|nr:MAG: hypothetical protein A3K73_01105 [Candidatus Pacearchaeota archaeon RBG_13_36_9]